MWNCVFLDGAANSDDWEQMLLRYLKNAPLPYENIYFFQNILFSPGKTVMFQVELGG